jgi:3-oxoacyl-[acyl-carrier-protein] synthase III
LKETSTLPKAKITALGCYVPPRILSNQDLEKLVETNDRWIVERTGIRERHILDESMATSDMAIAAARCALAQRGIEATEIDAIIVCTVTPDMLFPSTACLVQNGIGARGAWGFDLIAACSGFVYGTTTAAHLLAAGTHRKILVIGADTMSRILDYTDRSTCVLFGDGAGAVIVEAPADGEDAGFIDFLGRDRRLGRRFSEDARGRQPPAGHARNHRPTPALRASGRAAGIQVRRSQDVRNLPRPARAQRPHRRRYRRIASPPGQPAHH